MKKLLLFLLIFIISINIITAYDQILEYDVNDEIIYTTTVYRYGVPFSEASCNFTIFNPHPYESFINFTTNLNNKGNGIYSYNLTGMLDYNKNPYPISLYCNDSVGIFGSESRSAIKIGETMFDYTSGAIILLGIAIALMFASFKISDANFEIKNLAFFGSFAFFISALFYGLSMISKMPENSSFILVYTTTISIFVLMTMVFVWMFFKERLEKLLGHFTGTDRNKK